MDAKSQLRQYLEQRRDLGESEFVLDGMSVEEALRALGAMRSGPLKQRPRTSDAPVESDTRTTPPVADRVLETPVAPVSNAAAPIIDTTSMTDAPVEDVAPTADIQRDQQRDPPASSEPPQRRPATDPGADMPAKKFTPGLVVGSREDNLFEANPFNRIRTLDGIARTVAECTRCDLYKTAKNGVPGEGDPDADVMCVGEAPGANEDETGRPFVGAAGQLLTKILGAISLQREEVFIANVLKHRPPGNRNPLPDEVKACSPYLVRQIELVKPKVIIAFGTFAAQTLLATKTPIGKLRGMVHRYYGVPLVVTYHPAALLRNPAWKRPTWEDVQLARRVLDSAR